MDASGENEKRGKKVWKKKEEIKTTQRGNRCYRRASTCETAAVNKGFVRGYYIVHTWAQLQLSQLRGAEIFWLINSI